MDLLIVQLPDPSLTKTNKVYVNSNSQFVGKIIKFDKGISYFAEKHDLINEGYIALNSTNSTFI